MNLEHTACTLITAALKAELLPIQSTLQTNLPERQNQITYLTTGVGAGAVTTHLVPYLTHHPVKQVVNIGTAGAIGETVRLFDLFLPTEFYGETDAGIIKLAPQISPNLSRLCPQQAWRTGAILSVSSPITTIQQKKRLQALNNIDIVDMEVYTIQAICQRQQLPCYCLKVVTDYATEQADDEFRTNLDAALAKLAQAAVQLLEFIFQSRPQL